MADPAKTDWQRIIGDRDATVTAEDRAEANVRFEALNHRAPTPADFETLRSLQREIAQNSFDAAIDAAVTAHPVVDAATLKSLLYQESGLNASEGINASGYGGIAQLGAAEARAAALRVDATVDERLDPNKAIGAAAFTLEQKDRALHGAFATYGQPQGDERVKFDLAAYNGGEGTIETAMRIAYHRGLAAAQAQGLPNDAAIASAQNYATHFDNLLAPKDRPSQSPLYEAADAMLSKYGCNPHQKYTEISEYAVDVVARARQNGSAEIPPAAVPERANPPGHHATAELRSLEFGSHGADVAAAQRELGVHADGEFGPKTEHAVRSFQSSHGLTEDGIIGPLTRAALEKIRTEPIVPHRAGSPAGTLTAMQTFQKTWEANASVNSRTGTVTHPALSATLDQKNNTLDIHFRDRTGALVSATMSVAETSGGRYDAAHILPGNYQLGNFAWNAKGAETQGNGLNKSDYAYGAADIPITMRDGHDAVPVVLKAGNHISDGVYERFHGGGTGLMRTGGPDAPFKPHQPLTETNGCVRGENEDVVVVASLLEKSGKPIALTITRDTQSQAPEVQRSSDGGTTWHSIAPKTAITGRLHDAPNSEFVSIVTRNGNPPDTVSFKPEQLGFSKQQIEEIAARDPSGRISIGIDQYHHPVVNAQSDLARGDDQSRAPVGAQR